MRDVVILVLHLMVTIVRLARPGGLRSVVAESILAKHQLLILNRGRKRAPNLRAADRIIRGQGLPKYLSSDHDPLYRFHQWQANLRVLDATDVTSVDI